MIAMNSQINAAREATKTHTSDVETFKSGDFGFLGAVDQDRIVFARAPTRRQYIRLRGAGAARGYRCHVRRGGRDLATGSRNRRLSGCCHPGVGLG